MTAIVLQHEQTQEEADRWYDEDEARPIAEVDRGVGADPQKEKMARRSRPTRMRSALHAAAGRRRGSTAMLFHDLCHQRLLRSSIYPRRAFRLA